MRQGGSVWKRNSLWRKRYMHKPISTLQEWENPDKYTRASLRSLSVPSPGVVDDLIQSLQKDLCSYVKNIQHESGSSARQPLRIVRLVPPKWHHHHGNSVTQSLEQTM